MLKVCTDSQGQPTGYYIFKNEKNGMILHPLADGTLVAEPTSDDKDGVSLRGRQDGKYTSTIEFWDESAHNYYGYNITGDAGAYTLNTGSGSGSEAFSFAERKTLDPGKLHEIKTVDSQAAGVTIHMFNYPNRATIADVTGSDGYTEGVLPAQHVSMTLTNGYPTFQNGTKSGSTLFNPANSYHQGTGNHLFLEDTYNSTGYYEYNAFNNFAHYNKNTGNFTVYAETGTPSPTNGQFYFKRGNFMPYNELNTSASASRAQNLYNGDGKLLDYQDPTFGGTLYGLTGTDFYFGMTMEYEFMMPKNGMDKGNPLVYEFNGDDDLWIYIDGVLVLDIGGVHDAWPGSIHFDTGEIKGRGAGGATTIKDCFKNAGVFPDGTPWDDSKVDEYFRGNTFRDYGSHTFNMFYMEHGAGASNLETRFNLPVIEKGKVAVEKQLDNTSQVDYANVSFAYQAFKKVGSDYEPMVSAVYEGKTDPEGNPIPLDFYDNVTIRGKSYDNVFYLKPTEAAIFSDILEEQEYFVQEIGISSDYYDEIFVNDVKIDGQSAEAKEGIYRAPDATVRNRARVTFTNHCDNRNANELLITKRLAAGSEALYNGDTFEFRVMLESASGELTAYHQGVYYIRDDSGIYYKYEGGKLVPNGQTPYAMQAGNYGTIYRIPPDYTVVIKDLVAGTDFFVDEIRVYDDTSDKLLADSLWNQDSREVSECGESEIHDATIYDYATGQMLEDQSSLGRIDWNKDAQVEFTNSRKTGKLKIVKKLHDKSAEVTIPANAEFKIEGPAGYGENGVKTVHYSDFTGGAYTETVPTGTYTVTESGADLTGYRLVTTYEPESKEASVTEGTQPTDAGTVTVINNYIPIEPVADAQPLRIRKVDQNNKPMSGVTFTLANGGKSMTAVTDGNGECEFAITCGSGQSDLLPADERAPGSDTYNMTLTESPVTGYEPAGPWTVKAETKKNADGETEVTLSEVKERTEASGKILNYIERLIHWLLTAVTSDDPNYVFDTSGNTCLLTITNIRQTGGFEVEKKVESILASDKTREFSFKVELSDKTISGTYGDMNFTDGVANFTLKNGEKKAAKDIPTGTTYTVTETPDDGFITTKTGDTGTVEKSKDGAELPKAEFTNTRKTGDLTVSKTVNGPASDKAEKFTFHVTLGVDTISGEFGDMTFTDGKATFRLSDSESVTAKGLPTDVTYTVSEETPDGCKVVMTGETGTITVDGAEAKFTNTYIPGECSIAIGGGKTFENGDLTKNSFTFGLYEKGKENGAPLLTMVTDGSGHFSFAPVKYTGKDLENPDGTYALSREFVYVVSEIVPGSADSAGYDEASGIHYDLSRKEITIVVTNKGKGQMEASVKDNTVLQFRNVKDDPDEPEDAVDESDKSGPARTGDASNIRIYLAVLIAAIIGLAAAAIKRRRE